MGLATLSGARSLYAMAERGRLQSAEVISGLGFTRERTPAVSTLHEVFQTLDVTAFEAALARWGEAQGGARVDRVAIDGKGLRGIHGEALPGARLVAVYADRVGAVLAQAGGPVRAGWPACGRTHRRSGPASRSAACWVRRHW
ncbi:MAG: transposase family protein [Chloroflexi bacterium]|nr:transposase family protein [Chloroflexota bacterium]